MQNDIHSDVWEQDKYIMHSVHSNLFTSDEFLRLQLEISHAFMWLPCCYRFRKRGVPMIVRYHSAAYHQKGHE